MLNRGGHNQDVEWSSRRVSKCSGKENAYGLFLKKEGRRRFLDVHGIHFQNGNQEHQEMMGKIWKALTEEKRLHYKHWAADLNSDPQEVERRRRTGELRRRGYAHEHPEEIAKLRNETTQSVRNYQEQLRQDYGYVVLPKPESSIDPKPVLDSDLRSYRLQSRRDLASIFQFKYGNVYKRTFSYIGVLNYTAMLDSKTAKVIGFPCEICVIQFTLTEGVISHGRFKIRFDTDELIEGGYVAGNEHQTIVTIAKQHAQNFSEEHRICQTKGGSAHDAFEWLLDNIDYDGITVVDAVQFAAQVGTLKFVSERVGTNEQQAKFDKINFHCIQDVALGIKDAFPEKVPHSDESIERLLSTNMFLDKEGYYCGEHEKFFPYDMDTYYLVQMCPMHQALSQIQLYFHFCAENSICGFGLEHMTENHQFCTVNGETIPLYVAELSLSSAEYCARRHQNGMMPAPVIPEEEEAEDITIRKMEAMRINAAIRPNSPPQDHGPSRAPQREPNYPNMQENIPPNHQQEHFVPREEDYPIPQRKSSEEYIAMRWIPPAQREGRLVEPYYDLSFQEVDDYEWASFGPYRERSRF